MGLFSTLRDALGLQRPLQMHDHTAPLALSDAARQRLQSLPDGSGVHVETVEVLNGRAVQVTEGDSQGPPAPEFDPLPLTASDADLDLLRGRTLDLRDDRWLISLQMELRGRETPNPDGRLYMASRPLGSGRPAFVTPDGELTGLPARLLAIDGVQSVLFRDNTVTVERVPDTPWDRLDRAVDAAIREHFLLCGGPVMGTEARGAEGELHTAVRQVIEERIAPAIHRDGGDIELVGIADGVVRVALTGACRSCPASSATLQHGVERTLKQAFPDQVERVEQV
ncbi:MAG: NifU family protein [Myxococcales bacterium]|nr:NifU family protein [Myxococcales bacterium]